MSYYLIAFTVTYLAVLFLIKTNLVHIAPDQPNHRSLHITVTPRTGGLAIMLGILSAWFLMTGFMTWLILLIALITISLVDDMRGLAVRWRFIAQLFVCATFVYLFFPNLSWWMQVGALLMLVWMTNLYNFMDGSDGMAGGMAIFGFTSYALAANMGSDSQMTLMCGAIVAASVAFLIFNFHPAKIFLGDSGSIPLGFLAGAIGFYGWQTALWQFWFPLLVFSPFIVDATVTMLKRLFRREKVWQAHRSHYYQRLVQMGWGHRNTAIAEYVLMFLVGGSALLLIKSSISLILLALVFWLSLYLILMRLIDKRWLKMQHSESIF